MERLFSLVIPVHNGRELISRLFADLHPLVRSGLVELIIVANGCTDDTAAVARALDSRICVVETPIASKAHALNLGDAQASVFPRLYVDADVRVTPDALTKLAQVLRAFAPARVGSLRYKVNTDSASAAVKMYYRVLAYSEYVRTGHTGSGLYALNMEGWRRVFPMPPIIADDRYVQLKFAVDERVEVHDGYFEVEAPPTIQALTSRAIRILRGNAELSHFASSLAPQSGTAHRRLLGRILVRPWLWAHFVVYAWVYGSARARALVERRRGTPNLWTRI